MLIKVLTASAAAALLSTAAYAQQLDHTTSAHSPNTVNPAPEAAAPAATTFSSDVVAISAEEARARGITVEMVASAPVPDTPENRAKYGQPMSNAGKRTAPRAN